MGDPRQFPGLAFALGTFVLLTASSTSAQVIRMTVLNCEKLSGPQDYEEIGMIRLGDNHWSFWNTTDGQWDENRCVQPNQSCTTTNAYYYREIKNSGRNAWTRAMRAKLDAFCSEQRLHEMEVYENEYRIEAHSIYGDVMKRFSLNRQTGELGWVTAYEGRCELDLKSWNSETRGYETFDSEDITTKFEVMIEHACSIASDPEDSAPRPRF